MVLFTWENEDQCSSNQVNLHKGVHTHTYTVNPLCFSLSTHSYTHWDLAGNNLGHNNIPPSNITLLQREGIFPKTLRNSADSQHTSARPTPSVQTEGRKRESCFIASCLTGLKVEVVNLHHWWIICLTRIGSQFNTEGKVSAKQVQQRIGLN